MSAQHVYLCGHACLPQMGPSLHPYGFVKYLLLPSRFRNHSACLSIPCCQSMGRPNTFFIIKVLSVTHHWLQMVHLQRWQSISTVKYSLEHTPEGLGLSWSMCNAVAAVLQSLHESTVGVVNFALSALSNKPRYGVCSPGDHMMHSVGDATVAFVIYVFKMDFLQHLAYKHKSSTAIEPCVAIRQAM